MKRTVRPGGLKLATRPRPVTTKVAPPSPVGGGTNPPRAATKPATPRGLAAVLAVLVVEQVEELQAQRSRDVTAGAATLAGQAG
ncbi:MAG TPA: hypothetical protein VLA89_14310, partial [Gemmatimonadales bacterium]|nr:hypothetical protein [Gemmatimonadales bacterium]